MDPRIVVALIGGTATIGAAVVKSMLDSAKAATRRAESRTTAVEKAFETLTDTTSVTHFADSCEVTTVLDESGSGEHVRKWIGLHTNQMVQNLKIPYRYHVSCPGGSVGDPIVKESTESKLAASFVATRKTERLVEGEIVLLGNFMPGTQPVGYTLTQPVNKAVCLTREENEAAYARDTWKTEYIAAEVPIPVKSLTMSVTLPPSHKNLQPQPAPVVFIGGSETVNESETERIAPGASFVNGSASVVISNPTIGLHYAFYWLPPPDGTGR